MGFSFRKSFRLGPARLNISKSGLGVSTGIKGARVGLGTRGPYLAGGWKGIYYRKNLGATGGDSDNASALSGKTVVLWLAILLFAVTLVVLVWLVMWMFLLSNN